MAEGNIWGKMDRNPYQAPSASLSMEPVSEAVELASLGERLIAAIIDVVIQMAVLLAILFAMGMLNNSLIGVFDRVGTVVWIALAFANYVLLNGYLLQTSGQTIGKKVLSIRIVNLENELVPIHTILLLRYLPMTAIGTFFNLISFIDVLFVFRADRRCIHDFIAGTKVIKVHGAVSASTI